MTMRRWTPLIAFLVATVAFAGCIGDKDEPTPDGPGPATSGSTGAIQGTILTTSLEPVADALVGILQEGDVVADTRTASDGTYTLGDLGPGTYRLQVTGLCCRAAIKDIEVRPDVVTKGDMQLVPFTPDDLQLAYIEENEWKGFISCGVSTVALSAALCAFTEDTPVEDPNEEFLIEFNVSKGIRSLVVAMDWTPVGGVSGQTFNLLIENNDCGLDECSYTYADVSGEPPLVVRIDPDDITDPEHGWDKVTGERTLQFRVFAEGDASLVYQQPFDLYYHEFYWEEAPEGHDPRPDE